LHFWILREGEGREGRCVRTDAHVHADVGLRLCGHGLPLRGHERPRGRMVASARMRLVLSQVISKSTLQCVQVTDAPAAIVRLSIRKRPRDNHSSHDKGGAKLRGCHSSLPRDQPFPRPQSAFLSLQSHRVHAVSFDRHLEAQSLRFPHQRCATGCGMRHKERRSNISSLRRI
jgi:hypothetical protein